MRRFLSGLASASLVFVVAACNNAAPPPAGSGSANSSTVPESGNQGGLNADSGAQSERFTLGEPFRHRNLTIFPVLSKSPRLEDRFITLDEGLKAGTVEVRENGRTVRQIVALSRADSVETAESPDLDEVGHREAIDPSTGQQSRSFAPDEEFGEQPDVNRVTVVNRSDKPLYLMPGEVIVGGLQDRTIAEETIIPATGEPVSIDVYCVEQGRWNPEQNAAALLLGATDEDADAVQTAKGERGEFFAVPGFLNKSSRIAAQSKSGQGDVWNEVAKANADSEVRSQSSAYTANFVDDRVQKELQVYLQTLSGVVAQQERVVGVVVAINGKVESAEVFESTPLFLKLWPRLLRSFALDASHLVDAKESDKAASLDEARGFLISLLEEQTSPADGTTRGLILSRRDTMERISFSAEDASLPMMRGGSPVHAAGFSK